MNKTAALTALLLLSFNSTLLAQDLVPDRGEFFPKGHAERILEPERKQGRKLDSKEVDSQDSTASGPHLIHQSKDSASEFIKLKEPKQPDQESQSGQLTPEADPESAEDDDQAFTPLPIDSIGAVLDCSEPGRLNDAFAALTESLQRHDISGGQIYLVACRSMFPENQILPLVARGSLVKLVDRPPEEYQVTQSPTWVFSTKKGTILVEGEKSPRRFITSKGAFKDYHSYPTLVTTPDTQEVTAPENSTN